MQRSTAALRRLASAYDRYNTRRPLSTKAATCGVLLGGGDILCQGLESSAPFDPQRTGRMVTWGGLFNGPAGHVFYAQLDRFITMAGARGIACKIAVDQLLFTPPLTFAYFVWQFLLSSPSPSAAGAAENASSNLWPTLKVNWAYWSLVHIVTFAAIPLEYRVAFVAVKNFFWGGYLSWAATDKQQELQQWHRPPRQLLL